MDVEESQPAVEAAEPQQVTEGISLMPPALVEALSSGRQRPTSPLRATCCHRRSRKPVEALSSGHHRPTSPLRATGLRSLPRYGPQQRGALSLLSDQARMFPRRRFQRLRPARAAAAATSRGRTQKGIRMDTSRNSWPRSTRSLRTSTGRAAWWTRTGPGRS